MVRLDQGSLVVAPSSAGRGAWLCRDSPDCIDRAEKRKAFERALRGRVDHGQVDGIRAALVAANREMVPSGRAGTGSEGTVP